MTDFQKSLTRILYFAVIIIAALGVWTLARPVAKSQPPASSVEYGRYGQGVTTTGTCVVRTKPELAQVVIGIKQSSKSAKSTHNYIKSTMRKVTKVLKDGGVAAKDIQTQQFRLESIWTSGRNWEAKKWNGEQMMQVRIRDLDKVGELIDAAVKSGANVVSDLQYTVDDVGKLRAQGRERAAKVARDKAKQLASKLGGKLGKLVSCNESYPGDYNYGYWVGYYSSRSNVAIPHQSSYNVEGTPASNSEREELTLQPGEMVLNVMVTATYQVE
ncbi:MAG: SIMPL domain-containing protein [Armatimonadota bacterium]|nr:SIMPL domain-containing protein [Armatimonadota bacterium]